MQVGEAFCSSLVCSQCFSELLPAVPSQVIPPPFFFKEKKDLLKGRVICMLYIEREKERDMHTHTESEIFSVQTYFPNGFSGQYWARASQALHPGLPCGCGGPST